MNSKKPKDISEYKDWLKEKHEIEISDRTMRHYQSVVDRVTQDFERSVFWTNLTRNLGEFDSQYQQKTGYLLLMPGHSPKLDAKPFYSFLSKTFRKNILQNEHWPNPPNGGWILPSNWYSRVNDIVRTLLVVKYLDGVEFINDKIGVLCRQHGLVCHVFLEAKEEGYYAAHLYTEQEFEIPKIDWDTERVNMSVEIQITTQLQDVIRKLLHKYYEARRERISEEDIKWQWNYKSDEFVANYLGHILHYVEGMIMEVREKQEEKMP